MNDSNEIHSIPKSNLNAFGAWFIAGIYGLLTTIIWLGVMLEGDISGMAGLVIYVFIFYFIIGHSVVFLPFFLMFWRSRTSRIWLLRYMVPIGFLIASCATVLIKGRPIEELRDLKMASEMGLYVSMLAFAYFVPFKFARKSLL